MKKRFLITLILLVAVMLAAFPTIAQETPDTNLTDSCVTDFDPDVDYFPNKVEFNHAEGVTVEYFDHYKVVTVLTPWPGAEESFQYVLVQCGTPAPEADYENAQVIEVPVESVVTMSATELPRMKTLGVLDTLIGLDNIMYINQADVNTMYEAGDLVEVGEGTGVNVEILLDTEPDMVVTNSTGSADWDAHPLLLDAGITTVLNADWLETSPLGRAEWIKFTALFYNTEADAAEAFDDVRNNYQELAALTAELPEEERPTVFANAPFEGTWYLAGGASYFAQLLKDAGARYLWADDDSTGSLFLDFETVFETAADADYWLNPGLWTNLDEGLATDERFGEFAAFQAGNVYNNNARVNVMGFSDYFESGAMRPDIVLADLIAIFHPDLVPEHELVYYQQLKMSDE